MVNGACVSLANSPVWKWKWALPLPVLTWRWWCGSAPVLPYPRSAASPSPHWSPLSGSWSPLQSWWCNYLQTHTQTGYKTQCLICKASTHCTQCELDSCSNSTDQMTHNLLGGVRSNMYTYLKMCCLQTAGGDCSSPLLKRTGWVRLKRLTIS